MSSSPSHSFFGNQRGGTFLGLVIGLLVGLAVAFVVAIYVSKVPIPFVDKGVSRDPGEEAAEAKRNKDWDPNAPLYGRNAPRPQKKGDEGSEADAQATKLPVPASSPTPAPAPAAGPVLPPDGANVPPAPTNASDPDAANDPLGAFARSRWVAELLAETLAGMGLTVSDAIRVFLTGAPNLREFPSLLPNWRNCRPRLIFSPRTSARPA